MKESEIRRLVRETIFNELDKKTHLRAATRRQALADKEYPNQIGKDAQARSNAHMATYIDKDAQERGKRTGTPQRVTHHDFSGDRPGLETDESISNQPNEGIGMKKSEFISIVREAVAAELQAGINEKQRPSGAGSAKASQDRSAYRQTFGHAPKSGESWETMSGRIHHPDTPKDVKQVQRKNARYVTPDQASDPLASKVHIAEKAHSKSPEQKAKRSDQDRTQQAAKKAPRESPWGGSQTATTKKARHKTTPDALAHSEKPERTHAAKRAARDIAKGSDVMDAGNRDSGKDWKKRSGMKEARAINTTNESVLINAGTTISAKKLAEAITFARPNVTKQMIVEGIRQLHADGIVETCRGKLVFRSGVSI